jgi:DNA-binding response OmpR family regulator
MEADTARKLNALASQLAEALMTAATCAQEIRAAVRTEVDEADLGQRPDGLVPRPPNPVDHPHPVVDRARFTVTLGGRTCRLGNTIPFRFLARLADSPGRYVSHEQLIEDVWDGHGSDDALRSVVKHLRRRLREAGLDDLAGAIDGLTPGYFVLRLGPE